MNWNYNLLKSNAAHASYVGISAVTLTTTSQHLKKNQTNNSNFKKLNVFLVGFAGVRLHFPAHFEPVEDWGDIEEEEDEGRGEDIDRAAERPEEPSVEVQIGRKLREIGDKFQQDHVELVSLDPEQRSRSAKAFSSKHLGSRTQMH